MACNYYGVGRVSPGFGVDDNPATGSRSIGYGCDTCKPQYYGADQANWNQKGPGTLEMQPIANASRAAPGWADGRSVGYGADLPAGITNMYPGPLGATVTPPLIGTITIGTIVLVAILGFVAYKKGWIGKIKKKLS